MPIPTSRTIISDRISLMADCIAVDEAKRLFYVIDHGKYKIFSFELDSVLTNPNYLPQEKFVMDENLYPNYFYVGNDTLAVGLFWKPIGDSNYKPLVARWNMQAADIQLMTYTGHPEVQQRKRTDIAVSFEHDLYVECYWHYNLMTIGNVNGDFNEISMGINGIVKTILSISIMVMSPLLKTEF